MRPYAISAIVALLFVLIAGDVENDENLMQPVSEPPIKLVHVLNPGEREYLSPNLLGVQNIAMTFLPLTMNFINIVDAFREIVNGVRYDIVLNAINTENNDADTVCHLVILEKPWLRTEWGDKLRELQYSNCTSEADNLTDLAERSKALNDKYPRNAFFNGGSRNELSDEEMKMLNDQIVPFAQDSKETATTTTTTERAQETTGDSEREETAGTVETNTETTTTTDARATSKLPDISSTTTPVAELSEDEKNWLDNIFSLGALNFENSLQTAANNGDSGHNSNENVHNNPPQHQIEKRNVRTKRDANVITGGVSPLQNEEAAQRLQASLDKLASGEGPTYRISKVHNATTQVVSGTLTKIDCDLVDEHNVKERCNVEIWSQPWLPNGIEISINCPNKGLVKRRHSRSVEHAEKKTHKKHDHHNLNKVEHLFNKFEIKYNRRYHTVKERQMRLRIFRQNLKTIEELNRNEMGSAKYGITEFADMTSTEYKQRTGLWQRDPAKAAANKKASIPDIELPKEFDWREHGVVSPVKNQGNCGSCWAFSVTGNIEGLHAVKTGKLEEYSEQELLDCDTVDSACNGGLPDNAYEAIEKIGGLELESEYPYHGRKEQCQFNRTMSHVKVKSHVDLPKNETAIAQWLITNGPISIGINANAMQFYRGGVSHPWHPLCSHNNLDHGVLIVGYGISEYPMFKKTLPYWIVKNSWGGKWGEQGYYRVYRGDNTCGVSEMASSAVLADD